MKLPSSSSSSNRSSSSTITNQTEKTHQTPPVNSQKFTTKLDNSKPSECNKSRKRKKPEKKINLGLSLYDESCFNFKILDPPAYMGSTKSAEDIQVAKKLRSFRVYSHQEEEEEKYLGVSTKLQLFDDPWKIRKVLTQSDCNHLCRLMLAKDLVQKNIIDVWNHAGLTDYVAKIWTADGVDLEVLDYDRGMEFHMTFKNLHSSDCYIFRNNWIPKFVKERRLKRGDQIGLYWTNTHSKFVFSILSRS